MLTLLTLLSFLTFTGDVTVTCNDVSSQFFMRVSAGYFCWIGSLNYQKKKNKKKTPRQKYWGPPRGFGEQGNKAIYIRDTREQKSKTEGNKCNFGNREHRKSRFRFWETRENAIFFTGEQGNRYPPTLSWEGLNTYWPCSFIFPNYYYSFGFNDGNEIDGSFSHNFYILSRTRPLLW